MWLVSIALAIPVCAATPSAEVRASNGRLLGPISTLEGPQPVVILPAGDGAIGVMLEGNDALVLIYRATGGTISYTSTDCTGTGYVAATDDNPWSAAFQIPGTGVIQPTLASTHDIRLVKSQKPLGGSCSPLDPAMNYPTRELGESIDVYDLYPPPYTISHRYTSAFSPIAPCRLIDTRTIDTQTDGSPLSTGVAHKFRVQGHCGVPVGATTAALNIAIIQPSRTGHGTVWPAAESLPATSTVNFVQNQTIANAQIVPLSAVTGVDPDISIRLGMGAPGTAHVVIDVTGYFE